MKFADDGPYADPEKAARRIVEIASTISLSRKEPVPVEMPYVRCSM